jgi:putative DNA primase/helicase
LDQKVEFEVVPPEFSEDHLSELFTIKHRYGLRYAEKWGWLKWDGQVWAAVDDWRVFDLSRQLCREVSAEARGLTNSSALPRKLASSGTVAGVIKMSRGRDGIWASSDQWDKDPMLLNTPAGVADLRTGEVKLSDSRYFMTKITTVAPNADCPTPLWDAVLKRATNGDQVKQLFLRRAFGYGLTGLTREHVFLFLYGLGGNGKSVIVEAISNVLGTYHRVAPIEMLTESKYDRHPTDLAMLRGARLVTAAETQEGRYLNESLLKQLTGGDMVTARFMRQDFFDYLPQFLLVFTGNHRPRLRSTDEAIRRRMVLVPFDVIVPREERDPELGEKLKDEYPGILHQLIKGCLEWQGHGLKIPSSVRAATEQYINNEDQVLCWIEEHCENVSHATTSLAELFESWAIYTNKHRLTCGTNRGFGDKLADRGYQRAKRKEGVVFLGIRIKTR